MRPLGSGRIFPSRVSCFGSGLWGFNVSAHLLTQAQFKPISDKCCCPCFLLSGSGAYLSILGVIFTDKFIVQWLTDANWVGEATPHEDGRLHHLARVFYALRLAVAALDEYYDWVSEDLTIPKLVKNKPHPHFFPHPTGFREYAPDVKEQKWIDFEYINLPHMDPTNVTFIVQVKDQSWKLVIKFIERYGMEAHALLDGQEMAPRLLYCGLLDGETDVRNGDDHAWGSIRTGGLYVGPIRMVVMDYIEGSTLDKTQNPPEDTCSKIEKAIKTLHNSQFVFRDL